MSSILDENFKSFSWFTVFKIGQSTATGLLTKQLRYKLDNDRNFSANVDEREVGCGNG